MIKRFIFILIILYNLSAAAQNLAAVSGDKFNFQVERVLCDSVHNKLLVSSKFIKEIGNVYIRGICSWDGNSWDSLSSGINTHDTANSYPNGMALSCIPYNGKLLVGGQFSSVGGVNATSLALWDGIKWDSLPVRAFKFNDLPPQVAGFYKYNNLLYIYGTFDTIAGQPASGLATWDGISFHPIILPISDVNGIKGILEFQNELYVCGGFYDPGVFNGLRHILKFDGTNWVSVGGGLLGYSSSLSSMLIYKNELYVGGHFLKSEGNIGENVMKWDGLQWHDVSMGGGDYGGVWQMLVYHNKIWAFGSFLTAGNIYASRIAIYDSVKWCALYDTLYNNIGSAVIYNDTVYVAGGFQSVNSDTNIRYLAKIQYPNLFRECIIVNSIEEGKLSANESLFIYPNPSQSKITIEFSLAETKNVFIEIKNTLGQTIKTIDNREISTNKIEIDVSKFANGLYFVQIQSENTILCKKFVKQ